MRLRKYEAKIDRGSDGGNTSALGDNFSFCRWLKSNLLRAVVFPSWRISRHLSGEMFTLRRRWKFLRNWREADIEEDFFARAQNLRVMSK